MSSIKIFNIKIYLISNKWTIKISNNQIFNIVYVYHCIVLKYLHNIKIFNSKYQIFSIKISNIKISKISNMYYQNDHLTMSMQFLSAARCREEKPACTIPVTRVSTGQGGTVGAWVGRFDIMDGGKSCRFNSVKPSEASLFQNGKKYLFFN